MMKPVFVIQPGVQRYDWGAADGIPQLLGLEVDGGPYAEAWWGAHRAAPARSEHGTLDVLIAADPTAMLGERVASEWGGLPYLLKILSIAKPVSLQVHPTREQAHALNVRFGVDASPLADNEHKPEMVVALTPMRLQTGFRSPEDTAADLLELDHPDAARLADVVREPGGIESYMREVLGHPEGATLAAALTAARDAGRGSHVLRAAADAADAHPGDAGALVALSLEVIELEPGQACFTGAGIVHSYHSGLGLEIMASSDNVLRAGLTTKPVHVELLMEIADFTPSRPEIIAATVDGALRRFLCPAEEFALAIARDGEVSLAAGPRIVLCLEGETTLASGDQTLTLARGEAAFIPASDGDATLVARGAAAVAEVPQG